MQRLFFVLVALAVTCFAAAAVQAAVVIHIDIGSQQMSVTKDDEPVYRFAVSTGKPGYGTPTGTFGIKKLVRYYHSKKYDSPMPHSIFFKGDAYAIHGTSAVSQLGSPASHGCVRLAPGNAAALFALVKNNRGNTRVIITR